MAQSNSEKIEKEIKSGTQCDYVKFQAPVPPGANLEPVYEFKLESKDKRYKVDQISHNEHTLYWRHNKIIQETPWVNVQLARPILSEQ